MHTGSELSYPGHLKLLGAVPAVGQSTADGSDPRCVVPLHGPGRLPLFGLR